MSPVNPILVFLFLICLITVGCGFQLNRNRARLPFNATSISIDAINNGSYTPGLDLALRESLTDLFQRNTIDVLSPSVADVALSVDILSASRLRRRYSYDESGREYFEFVFTIQGRLSVTRNENNASFFTSPPVISGTYSIKTDSEDLSRDEIEEGNELTIENLSNQIINELTRNF